MKLFGNKKRRKRRRKRTIKLNERFATSVIIIIGVTTLLFIIAQYVSFLITRVEQTTLIERYFTVVGVECGALMLKRVAEVIFGRIKKKEGISPDNNESEGS
nr:MAG TPA: hypothetical protein [Caudoviricetes sp.]